MLDSCSPYQLIPVQKSSPGKTNADSFDEAYIYKFFTEGTAKYQRLKYIIRVEKYDNAFALKFYAARDRKNDNKYHRIINAYGYRGLVRLLLTCLQVMPDILNKFPKASFVVNGANSIDSSKRVAEEIGNSQRFRIYNEFILRKISDKKFAHFYSKNSSSIMLVNRSSTDDVNAEADRLRNYLLDIYDFD